ncbi:MAG: dTDP-4-dehydrorhamnose 3,5-epimerase [Vulcanimicrobiaceae bacterium]
MPVEPTVFAEVRILTPELFEDERGYFKESYSQRTLRDLGIDVEFVQDNLSFSLCNVLRGMHFDLRMAKLVQVFEGKIFDAFVDMREGSPTFKRWGALELSSANHRQVFIPAGFAHGFLTLSSTATVMYKQTAPYDPAQERSISWRDPQVGIVWPLSGQPRLSAKDAAL